MSHPPTSSPDLLQTYSPFDDAVPSFGPFDPSPSHEGSTRSSDSAFSWVKLEEGNALGLHYGPEEEEDDEDDGTGTPSSFEDPVVDHQERQMSRSFSDGPSLLDQTTAMATARGRGNLPSPPVGPQHCVPVLYPSAKGPYGHPTGGFHVPLPVPPPHYYPVVHPGGPYVYPAQPDGHFQPPSFNVTHCPPPDALPYHHRSGYSASSSEGSMDRQALTTPLDVHQRLFYHHPHPHVAPSYQALPTYPLLSPASVGGPFYSRMSCSSVPPLTLSPSHDLHHGLYPVGGGGGPYHAGVSSFQLDLGLAHQREQASYFHPVPGFGPGGFYGLGITTSPDLATVGGASEGGAGEGTTEGRRDSTAQMTVGRTRGGSTTTTSYSSFEEEDAKSVGSTVHTSTARTSIDSFAAFAPSPATELSHAGGQSPMLEEDEEDDDDDEGSSPLVDMVALPGEDGTSVDVKGGKGANEGVPTSKTVKRSHACEGCRRSKNKVSISFVTQSLPGLGEGRKRGRGEGAVVGLSHNDQRLTYPQHPLLCLPPRTEWNVTQCNATAPLKGAGAAIVPCQSCERKHIDCEFRPLNKRGASCFPCTFPLKDEGPALTQTLPLRLSLSRRHVQVKPPPSLHGVAATQAFPTAVAKQPPPHSPDADCLVVDHDQLECDRLAHRLRGRVDRGRGE